ncbi:dolichol kinase NDAI_0B01580 [Naumovozyma dairenensis CBS 421]|uniref:dolichol kinase n=1 Tax=Naumovozyma dairenensis (strain ATCC 10597 / BCRC 20456 / CBS 421 / NBRC 0211 / NRRL Y-12639) TaxID=1071378 RepID=G0W5Y1_NAUDC|nr:hypothetical protein NDAI_0B01580 [Naumovozyma dairenensis CBS 421]CCD23192.1 hypothetical protein NDAI_0B01580 [Naumovozyma dairenensis CBS 421]
MAATISQQETVQDQSELDKHAKNSMQLSPDVSPPNETKSSTSYFSSKKFIQLAITFSTLYLAYTKHKDTKDELDCVTIFKDASRVIVILLANIFMNYANNVNKIAISNGAVDNNVKTNLLPPFDVCYLVYLPFMVSFLFCPSLAIFNTTLTLNVLDVNIFKKLTFQVCFIIFDQVMSSSSTKDDIDKLPLIGIAVNYTISELLMKIGEKKSLDLIDSNLFSIILTNILIMLPIQNDNMDYLPLIILRNTLYAFIIIVSFNWMVSTLLIKLKFNQKSLHITLLINFIIALPLTINVLVEIPSSSEKSSLSPSIWLFDFINSSSIRKTILILWLSFLLVLIPNIIFFKSNFSLNTSRKIWHFLIFLLLIKPFQMDPFFIKIALSGTIVLFLSIEYLRFINLHPIGPILNEHLKTFTDYRDNKGPLIISYIYLIIGISIPLLVNNSPIGLISLGIGDSMASIIGGKFGHFKWPGSKKTLEGTMAFILTTSFTCYCLKTYFQGFYFNQISMINLFYVCTLSGILEGNSQLNDNILIPTFMMIIEELLSN